MLTQQGSLEFILWVQSTEAKLKVIYNNFQLSLAASVGTTSSIESLLTPRRTTIATTLTTTPGCARTSGGGARLEFAISHSKIPREETGMAARRKLQSTPCSATDGTSVRHCLTNDACFVFGSRVYSEIDTHGVSGTVAWLTVNLCACSWR